MPLISVLFATLNPGSTLPRLVRALDAQTLPMTDFEVVVVDASNDGSTARLQQLAGRRPNVTVLTRGTVQVGDADQAEGDGLGLALERATGEYVLVVAQQQLLAPRALELLLDRARRTDADLVLGRVVTESSSGCATVPDDADRFEAPAVVPAGGIALVRRSLLASRPSPAAALLDLPASAGAATAVSALGRYACAKQDGGQAAPGTDAPVEPPVYRWVEGMLQLSIRVRLPASASSPLQAWLVLTRGLADVALPATIGPDEREAGTWTVSAVLDPRTAEGGHPLDDGPWTLMLRLAWPGREVTLPLPPAPGRSAVVAGRPYVVQAARGIARLDAGATATSVIGPVPRSRASVTESVHGTLVTLDHPDLHVHGDAVLEARLLLDGFALPGRLVCENASARLEVFASSLAGTSAVSVVAGGGKPVPTGLRLRVDATGGMAFETATTPERPHPAGPPPAASAPLAQRMRRRLPGALDPVVHRLAGVPVLRRTYRRLINR